MSRPDGEVWLWLEEIRDKRFRAMIPGAVGGGG